MKSLHTTSSCQAWQKGRFLIVLLLIGCVCSMPGCKKKYPEPTPGKGKQAPPLSIVAVAQQWAKSITDNNRELFDSFIIRLPAGEETLATVKARFDQMFVDAQDKGVTYAILDAEKFEGDATAGVAVLQVKQENGFTREMPVYMLFEKQDENETARWRVLASLDQWDVGFHRLSDEEKKSLQRAEEWYNTRDED